MRGKSLFSGLKIKYDIYSMISTFCHVFSVLAIDVFILGGLTVLFEGVLQFSRYWTHSLVLPHEMGQVLPCCMFLQCFAVSAGTYLYPGKSLSSRSVSCLKPKTASLKEGSCIQKQASQSE